MLPLILPLLLGCSSPSPSNDTAEQAAMGTDRHCTVLHASNDGVVLGGANEDWIDSSTRFWIIPAEAGQHGWIKFGFAGGFPQSGVNDAGLFWDATGSPYLEMPLAESTRTFYDGPLMVKVMEDCGSVEQARAIFEQYYCEDQYEAQYLVGDANGSSIIVEGDSIIPKDGPFQVLTNFYQSHPQLGGFPCWRYQTATEMLGSRDSLTPYRMGQVLDATHQDGKYPTQYSVIYDLQARRVYLFHFHNFHEYLVVDLEQELQNAPSSYDIPPLFSGVHLADPANGAQITGSAATLKWSGKPASTYSVCVSQSSDPTGACFQIEPIVVSAYSGVRIILGAVSSILLLFAVPCRSPGRRLTAISLAGAVLMAAAACDDGPADPTGEHADMVEMSYEVSGLEVGATYYWKILAKPAQAGPLTTESITFEFKTTQ